MRDTSGGPDGGGDDVRAALRALSLFADFAPEQLEDVVRASRLLRLRREEWLFRRGEAGESMFVVVSGRLEIVSETTADEDVIRWVTRGALIGELSPVAREPRPWSVRAVHDAELVEVGRDAILRILWRSPATAVLFSTLVARQLNYESASRVADTEPVRALSVVSLDSALTLAELASAIAGVIGGRVGLMYDGERAPSRLSEREAFAEYSDLLRQQTVEHEHVLLLDDRRGANQLWSSFVLQHGQVVLAVVSPRTAIPVELARDLRGCHLLLVGQPDEFELLPSWLDSVQPASHHFVFWNEDRVASLERLTRRVLGRSLGLVLSGGGAAGLAHIGVLQVLRAGGIGVDRIGGCSMGAFVGALYALGMEPEEMIEVCRKELIRRKPFGDYTVPRHSLIKGRRAEAMFKRLFHDTPIEHLPMDYFCVSADLLSAELIVHRRGPLWEAVGISMSVPGLAPPRHWNGRLLVDGGILDNLPIDVMAEKREGPIIAVDVIGRRIADRVNPDGTATRRPRPRIGDTLVQSMVLGSHHRLSRSKMLADLVIAPDVSGVSLLDFGHLDTVVEAGRVAAERALADVRRITLGAG